MSTHEQLAHSGSCGKGFQVSDPGSRLRPHLPDGDAAQGVEAVRLHPEIGIDDPHASGLRIVKPGNGFVNPTVGGVYEADPASGHPLPTRVSDLAAEGERGLE